MKTLTSTLLFLCIASFCYSQPEKLNQLDTSGKKNGKWIVYLDKNWKEIKDSVNADYFRYTFYDHGTNIYLMGTCGKKNWKLESANNDQQIGKIKLLDGEYKWMDEKGQTNSIHVLKNGEYISCKEFYSSGKLNQYFDYTKKWKDEPHTWYVSIYDEKGNIIRNYYMQKDKDGHWPTIR